MCPDVVMPRASLSGRPEECLGERSIELNIHHLEFHDTESEVSENDRLEIKRMKGLVSYT